MLFSGKLVEPLHPSDQGKVNALCMGFAQTLVVFRDVMLWGLWAFYTRLLPAFCFCSFLFWPFCSSQANACVYCMKGLPTQYLVVSLWKCCYESDPWFKIWCCFVWGNLKSTDHHHRRWVHCCWVCWHLQATGGWGPHCLQAGSPTERFWWGGGSGDSGGSFWYGL